MTDEEKARLEQAIARKVEGFRTTLDPSMGGGDFHDEVCPIPVIADPPGTGSCPPCPP